jgi:hypothetical protein
VNVCYHHLAISDHRKLAIKERLLTKALAHCLSIMTCQEEHIEFDPGKVRFDLSLSDAFALTSVRSLQEFFALLKRLPKLCGQSYFFINILSQRARLIMTIITARDQEITATYELDPRPLGIAPEELMSVGREDGNYPVPPDLVRKIECKMVDPRCNFVKST